MRPEAKLLVYEALSYKGMRPSATSVCGLQLLAALQFCDVFRPRFQAGGGGGDAGGAGGGGGGEGVEAGGACEGEAAALILRHVRAASASSKTQVNARLRRTAAASHLLSAPRAASS
jgi:hypothetical protein